MTVSLWRQGLSSIASRFERRFQQGGLNRTLSSIPAGFHSDISRSADDTDNAARLN